MKNQPQAETGDNGHRFFTPRQIRMTFIGVVLATLLASLDQTIVGTTMPRIISDLGGFSHYTWVTSAYVITSALVIPITGKLTDIYGRKYFYVAGVTIFILASFGCGISNSIGQLITLRGIQGIGGGMMTANAFTVIGDIYAPNVRVRYQGYVTSVWGLAALIGPVLGGFITDALSWHWVFFVNVPLGIVVIVMLMKYLPQFRPGQIAHRVDYLGIVTFILFMAPLLIAVAWGGTEYPWNSGVIIGLFISAIAIMLIFLIVERRHPEPIIPLSLFTNRIVALSQVVIFLTAFAMFGSIIFIPLFFQAVLGTSATTSGALLVPMVLAIVVGAVCSGLLLPRSGGRYRLFGALGLIIMLAGTFYLSRITSDATAAAAIWSMILVGFGLGITLPLYTAVVQNAVNYCDLGAATSSIAFFRSIGGSVGLAIFGTVLTQRFATEFTGRLSPALKAVLPPERLSALTSSPQALLDPATQSQLQALFPAGSAASYQELLSVLKASLAGAISQIFWIGFIAVALSLALHFMIKQIPLRAHHDYDGPMM